ncbi:caspase family protein [Methylobacterium nodulans]|uniref:Peptidase C14 caspase catalytic subunit p20 n=1 Tax=Methylobacterium nodulans (strain LMG 21967 / CNCM I-2342 / ORS 2060) TaxID=460265 RepID=B8ILZ1_METNO|nr:caspase family protein [Methylobacterium nodulans]ACL56335.1 peptidase C14 caspase catalytic subunit p20 [Methylobacterium nodulans ORS 2060]
MRALWIVGIVLAFSACLAIQPVFAQSKAGDRIALVIGNAQYPDSDTALTTPVPDARALATALQQKGYTVDVNENMAKLAMQAALARLYDKIKSGSTVLFYFSGYGIQSNKQNYLIPVDAQIWTEPDLRRDGFNVETIIGEIQKRGADLKVVILDAANRNPFERRFRSFANGLAPVAEAPPNTLVFYSTQPGQMLRQVSTAKSAFAEELVRQIGSTDALTRTVFDRARSAVSTATQGAQLPWLFSTLKDSPAPKDSPTAWVDPGPAKKTPEKEARIIEIPGPGPGPTPAGRPEPSPDPAGEFSTARRAGTKEAFERFLGRFPDGAWAERARAEIARLDEHAKPAPAPKVPQPPLPYNREEERLKAELNKALERNPADGAALYRRGQLYAIHREYTLALADFDEVIRLNPQDVEALNNRCWVRAMIDELDRALRDCNEALKLRPNFPDALDSRGLVNLKIGLPGLAIRDYDAALKGNGKQASSLYGRGMARVRTGETEEGKSDINDALRMDPGLEKEFAQYGIR